VRSKSFSFGASGPGPEALALLESSSVVGCFRIGPDGAILGANALGREWLGTDKDLAAEGPQLDAWLPQARDRELVRQALSGGDSRRIEVDIRLGAGTCLPVVGDLMPVGGAARRGCVAIFCDATSRRQLSAGLQRSARLEALGSLASGVAHDFNNLLTILVGNLALVAEDLRDRPKPFAKLKAARDAARRGGDLIRQLLSFARQEPVPSELINPSRVIASLAPLIERALGRRIRFELELDEGLDPVAGNSAQLESVIVNLAVNARDAIEGSGCVRISVSSTGSDNGSVDRTSRRGDSACLCIEVADDGSGIPLEVADKVFEPFFTTKSEGRGSGLGLSMVKAYATQFGGEVTLVSRPGSGTRVRLLFPFTEGRAEESAAMTTPLAALPTGTEHLILLVAEENLSSMMEQILSLLGYRCETAKDLGAASRLLKKAKPDLVISDGFEVRALLGLENAAPAGTSRVLMLRAVGIRHESGSYPVLHKPFSLPDLATAVRAALDR
jgi:signal transduction histidine kinase